MSTILNFGYLNWIKSKVLKFSETEIICQHEGYKKEFGVIHQRQINLYKKEIIITDKLLNQKIFIKVNKNMEYTIPN